MLQQEAYLTQALGKVGMVSREDPVPQSHPVFVEGNNVEAGRFGFVGSQSNQIVGIGEANEVPEGIVIFDKLQLNTNGGNSTLINNGETARKLVRGCAFIYNDGEAPNYNDNVLVDPLTGKINCSSETSQTATAGKLMFAEASSDLDSYKAITVGSLNLTIDGTLKALTGLNFSTATSIADVATAINTALGDVASCTEDNGVLIITSATTGINSSVVFDDASSDLAELLGGGIEITGTNAMINTGWKVLSANESLQAIEVQKI